MQKLNNHTVRLLSGTQVITSVHSVVKELVENSLDSGATNVEVNLENYGLDKVEVRDNGCGISKDEAPFIAKCHHTSKLADISELDTLQTFGFRGEALSSLATVASLSIATATQQDEVGMVYTFDTAGNVASKRPIAAGVGTCVTATDMFVNLPVRRQFYKNVKQCRDDLRRIEHLMIAFGLSHSNVRFVLRHSKNVIWQKAVMSSLHSNMIAVFGTSLVQQMKYLQNKRDYDKDGDEHNDSVGDRCTELSGYFPLCGANSSEITRSSAERMFVYVNKRSVEIKQINQLARDLFKLAYPNQSRRYPVMCLFIKVPQNEVDVNLEPGKRAILLYHLDKILDQLANLMGQLYKAEDSEEVQELVPENENYTTPASNNLSQFRDNAVLSPPTTDVQLSGTAVLTSDDLHTMPIASRDIEQDIMELQNEPVDTVLEEEAEDTVLLTPDDSTTAPCNEERTINEEPGGDVLHWSRGQCRNRQEMEPVRLLHRDTTNKPCHTVQSAKKSATSLKLTREGSRSMKSSNSHKMKLSNFFAKISTSQPSKPPEVTVDFSLDRAMQYWEEGSNLAVPASDKLRVIGPIHYRHQWLVLVHQDISLFNVKQANQEALYYRLLTSFKLPVTPLPTAISINECSVGGLDNMALLSALQSESTAANGNRFYCDVRLLANGFGVSERIVDGKQCIELVSLHKSVGINDLLETLALIKEQALKKELSDVTLRECRPLSVQKILQEESVRMSNIQLGTLQAADVLELLQNAHSQCFHLVHKIGV